MSITLLREKELPYKENKLHSDIRGAVYVYLPTISRADIH